MTFFIFTSSSMRYFLLCNLPAVSHIKTSAFFSLVIFMASYTTDAGSTPSSLFTISQSALFAHTSNCSTAAALKVSAAATTTFFPSCFNLFAIFPIDVVFPTPFTPTTNITDGFVSKFRLWSVLSNISCISFLSAFFTPSSSFMFSFFTLSLRFSIIAEEVLAPTSDIIRASSNSSNKSSSTFLKLLNISFIFSSKDVLVLFNPFFSLSKKLIIFPFIIKILVNIISIT